MSFFCTSGVSTGEPRVFHQAAIGPVNCWKKCSIPPGPPPIQLKFFGTVDTPRGAKVAALTDGKAVFHGREGDIIDGRYRIVRIGVESIVLEYADGRGRTTIPLRGQ